jgi:hypothetical protein
MRYDCLIVDVLNVAHRYFNYEKEKPAFVSKKQVFKQAVCNFIEKLEQLEKEYLHSTGDIYLLFDNPTSRADLQSSFYFADRKEAYSKYKKDRAKQPKEFYNSVNLLKYYYMVSSKKYHVIQIPRLEADDLVEPILRRRCQNKTALLVSNDLDWVRYLSESVDWIPDGNTPETVKDLSYKMGFPITCDNVVAYKALFGDSSDNIPSIVPPRFHDDFTLFVGELQSADDLLFIHTKDEMIKKYPFLSYVQSNTNQLRINLQLVRAIPVKDEHIERVIIDGRNSQVSKKAVRRSIGLDDDNPGEFVFGNIRRPRV